MTATDWSTRAARLQLPSEQIIAGRVAPAADGRTFDVIAPRDGAVLGAVPDSGAEDVDRAVAAARAAFAGWAATAPAERKRLLLRFSDLVDEHREELALLMALEMGKPVDIAHRIEMRTTVNCYRWYAEWADKLTGETPEVGADALALVTREPVGVVGVVVPWNFPMTLTAWKVAPALAAGCTVVVKPSEFSPLSMLRLAALALEAGLPDGVLNVVTGYGPVVPTALGRHRDVDAIAFTGSTAVGRKFLTYAADSNLKRVWLELGGKSPSIVLPDADLDAAAASTAGNIFFNQGEMCTAPSRLLVHRDVREEVVARVVEAAGAIAVGDPLDPSVQMGPLISGAHRARVHAYVDGAVHEGATVRAGAAPIDGAGFYYSPTVLDGVTPQMTVAREEVFGPVLSVLEFETVEQAVALANDTDYGLAAAVWTRDLNDAHSVSRRLRAGTVWVNCYEEGDMSVPFGGFKQSGNGRDKSVHALDKYTELKTTWIALDGAL
jgi:gamma-glutamyl-gamma-aminobutyraldehyde dehydrogenase